MFPDFSLNFYEPFLKRLKQHNKIIKTYSKFLKKNDICDFDIDYYKARVHIEQPLQNRLKYMVNFL